MLELLVISLTLSTTLSSLPPAGDSQRCFLRVNQPAASVRLNRSSAPTEFCVKDCATTLIGTHSEDGQLVAVAIYTGKRCQ